MLKSSCGTTSDIITNYRYQSNFELNRKEIEERKATLLSLPRRLFIIPTKKCNLNCIMCPRVFEAGQADLPPWIINEIISILPYLELIEWQGGEVFLFKSFQKLLHITSYYPNLKQVITTSCLLIDEEWADLIVKNNIELRISIDSVLANTYEHIRRGGKFARLIKSLEIINK